MNKCRFNAGGFYQAACSFEKKETMVFLSYRLGDKPGTYEIVPAEADVVRRIADVTALEGQNFKGSRNGVDIVK